MEAVTSAVPHSTTPQSSATPQSPAASQPPNILVVDDEESVRTMFETKFRKQIRRGELIFLFAMNGEEALHILENSTPIDVIFTDLNMPRMDGITFLKHLNEDNGHIPAIVITAYGDYDRLLEAINSGASGFLGKPINLAQLEETITRCLRQQEKLKQRIESLECELLQTEVKVLALQDENKELEARNQELENRTIDLNVRILKLNKVIEELTRQVGKNQVITGEITGD